LGHPGKVVLKPFGNGFFPQSGGRKERGGVSKSKGGGEKHHFPWGAKTRICGGGVKKKRRLAQGIL